MAKQKTKPDPAAEPSVSEVKTKIVKGKHSLTDQELIENSQSLASAMKEKEALESAKSEKAKEIAKMIADQDATIKVCLDKIRTGEEDRDYQCKEEKDFEKKVKNYVSIEDGRVIKSVPFQASDYQLETVQPDELDEEKTEEKE
jgi:hypothetical protein